MDAPLFPDEHSPLDVSPLATLLTLAVGLTLTLALAYTTLVDPATQAAISARNGASGYAQRLSADDPRFSPPISPERQAEYNRILHENFGRP